MKKSRFRMITAVFLACFLFLFGIFVYLFARQQACSVVDNGMATVDPIQGDSSPSSLESVKRIGFRYSNDTSEHS